LAETGSSGANKRIKRDYNQTLLRREITLLRSFLFSPISAEPLHGIKIAPDPARGTRRRHVGKAYDTGEANFSFIIASRLKP
jgi:hypothetical protein